MEKRQPDIESLIETLKGIVCTFDCTYVVIDALDECSDKMAEIICFFGTQRGTGLATQEGSDRSLELLNTLA